MLKTNKQNFVLDVCGPHTKYHLDYCEKWGVSQLMKFHGEIEHQHLSAMLRKSDALILYSRYETFGCVYVEAMASGVPVISSDIPVAHEIIRENFSGYFTEGENPEKLAEKMEWFINHAVSPDKKALAENAASLYSPEFIGRRFFDWYIACLQAVPGNDYRH
jgi:glycosyltransferase involved in cell wall biosynthesis